MTGRLEAHGRRRADMLFMQATQVLLASTEEEAKRKNDELDERLGSEANVAFFSSTLGADLSQVDLDQPLGNFATDSLQGNLRVLAESAPDKSSTFRDVVRLLGAQRIIGTPQHIADELEKWRDAGVDGINLNCMEGVEGTYDFLDHAVPVLQERGLMQQKYRSGTLRDKLFRR
jgi:alkanesulfonate monooxygenase SsuD/methylene tetrahydromethanopterin reductase-like flavin-dependent oxidoreductase (luciferase family)